MYIYDFASEEWTNLVFYSQYGAHLYKDRYIVGIGSNVTANIYDTKTGEVIVLDKTILTANPSGCRYLFKNGLINIYGSKRWDGSNWVTTTSHDMVYLDMLNNLEQE